LNSNISAFPAPPHQVIITYEGHSIVFRNSLGQLYVYIYLCQEPSPPPKLIAHFPNPEDPSPFLPHKRLDKARYHLQLPMASAAHRAGISSPSYSARNSREHLIPKSQRPRSLHGSHVRSSRVLAAERKLANKGGVAIEQKRSHGIGGAGNIRMYFFDVG
jgi:hypothetical protein